MPYGFFPVALAALAAAALPSRPVLVESAGQTTALARKLVLERIDAIAREGHCSAQFGQARIDLDRVRRTALRTRFYNSQGPEGNLRFSEVVGKAASPDGRLRELSRRLTADAFVLGYQEGSGYVRTKHVVLGRGYFEQPDSREGSLRPTTGEEKQALLLHEVLHIALDVDDDDLTRRRLCPLRLLAFCRRGAGGSEAAGSE